MTSILGISAFYHDSAAALVVDGTIAAAAQEERVDAPLPGAVEQIDAPIGAVVGMGRPDDRYPRAGARPRQ